MSVSGLILLIPLFKYPPGGPFLSFLLKKLPLFIMQGIPRSLVFLSTLLTVFSVLFAQTDEIINEEIEFYQKRGIQPFVSNQQDGDYPAGTYLVLHDLTIEKGKIMTLYPGTKILFKKDTRLYVNGILICQGKPGEPVVFEKLDNNSYFTPVDSILDTWWDGIYLADSATLEMKHTQVNNSKYGIVAKPATAGLSLDSVQFKNNKYHAIRFGNDLPDVPEKKILTISWSGLDGMAPQIKVIDTTLRAPTIISDEQQALDNSKLAAQKRDATKKHLRWTSGIVTVVGAGISVGGYYMNQHYYSLFKKYNNPETTETSTVGHYWDMRTAGMWIGIGGAALSAVGLTGFTLTFVF
jgi:hypothetical protein